MLLRYWYSFRFLQKHLRLTCNWTNSGHQSGILFETDKNMPCLPPTNSGDVSGQQGNKPCAPWGHWFCTNAGIGDILKRNQERIPYMQYSVVLILTSLLAVASQQEIMAQPLSPPLPAGEHCEQNRIASERIIVGPYPLQVTVMSIDYEKGEIDFATEVGTFLHVIHAPAYELQRLKVGDKVALCIAEELHGDLQT
jgi:hypothetical protein